MKNLKKVSLRKRKISKLFNLELIKGGQNINHDGGGSFIACHTDGPPCKRGS
jgi:hypothetical protein